MAVKRTISFNDVDDEPVVEDWYFLLDEESAANMKLAHREDLAKYLADIQKNHDHEQLLYVMREMLFASVCRREGKLLVNDEPVKRQFRYGGAFKQLFADLLEENDGGMGFFISIMPASVQAKVVEEAGKTYTKDDLIGMTDEEFFAAVGTDDTKYTQEQLLIAYQRRNRPAVTKAA